MESINAEKLMAKVRTGFCHIIETMINHRFTAPVPWKYDI